MFSEDGVIILESGFLAWYTAARDLRGAEASEHARGVAADLSTDELTKVFTKIELTSNTRMTVAVPVGVA